MKIEIYDPAMRCSSGLCGPTPDAVPVGMNDAVMALKNQGADVERFNLVRQPKSFKAHREVVWVK
ncbi:MAG: arsenic metallochaperone ArsD family protein [Nitrospirota bacterium]